MWGIPDSVSVSGRGIATSGVRRVLAVEVAAGRPAVRHVGVGFPTAAPERLVVAPAARVVRATGMDRWARVDPGTGIGLWARDPAMATVRWVSAAATARSLPAVVRARSGVVRALPVVTGRGQADAAESRSERVLRVVGRPGVPAPDVAGVWLGRAGPPAAHLGVVSPSGPRVRSGAEPVEPVEPVVLGGRGRRRGAVQLCGLRPRLGGCGRSASVPRAPTTVSVWW